VKALNIEKHSLRHSSCVFAARSLYFFFLIVSQH